MNRIVALGFGLLALVAVAVAAGQKADAPLGGNGPPTLAALNERLKAVEDAFRAFRAGREKHAEDISWLSQNVYRPGMILPYHGPLSEAVALEKEGWFVCDGRQITDHTAAERYKGQTTPDFKNRFLKGATESGALTGQETVTTSVNGRHNHLLPAAWYARGLGAGNFSGIDANAPENGGGINNGRPPVQENGDHSHTVAMDPPAYSVIYMMYVREVTAKP